MTVSVGYDRFEIVVYEADGDHPVLIGVDAANNDNSGTADDGDGGFLMLEEH